MVAGCSLAAPGACLARRTVSSVATAQLPHLQYSSYLAASLPAKCSDARGEKVRTGGPLHAPALAPIPSLRPQIRAARRTHRNRASAVQNRAGRRLASTLLTRRLIAGANVVVAARGGEQTVAARGSLGRVRPVGPPPYHAAHEVDTVAPTAVGRAGRRGAGDGGGRVYIQRAAPRVRETRRVRETVRRMGAGGGAWRWGGALAAAAQEVLPVP